MREQFKWLPKKSIATTYEYNRPEYSETRLDTLFRIAVRIKPSLKQHSNVDVTTGLSRSTKVAAWRNKKQLC